MPLDNLPKLLSPSSPVIVVGQARRPSGPATEVVVEVQGPRPFLDKGDLWRTRAVDRLGIVMRGRWGKPAQMGRPNT